MSVPIHVDAHAGYKANQRPLRFILNDLTYEVEQVEDQWYSPEATYFKIRTLDGKRCILRYAEQDDSWTLSV